MSYTKFSKELTKWLKDEGLPSGGIHYEDAEDVKQAKRAAWELGRGHIFKQWLEDKRYKELISCAHGGWYSEDKFLELLAVYFVKEQELLCLQFLCERGIRFYIEDLLFMIKHAKENGDEISVGAICNGGMKSYSASKIVELRKETLDKLNRYITYLEEIKIACDYLETVNTIKEKVVDLSIRKSDLKNIKNKL